MTPQHTMLYDVPIIDCKGEKTFIKAYEIEAICDEVALFDNHVAQLFKNLKIEDVARPNANVDLLIGSDHINIHPIKIRCNGRLALFKSFFGTGRVLGGCHPSLNNNGIDQINNLTKVVALGKAKNFRVMNPNKLIFEDLGVSVPPRCNRKNCPDCTFEAHQLSQNEQKELDVIRSNLKLDPCQNKYVTSYPFKVDPSILPNNEVQADALLFKTEKQLLRNKAACDSYCEQFEDAIRRGVYKEITQEELYMYDGPVFYVTQHPVYKEESSSTPIRIVSNASLKFKGISLNDILMKGPNALSDLFRVQLNFRNYLVAAVSDIKKMYHSISTTIIERHVRRVKWRGMDLNVKPKIYGTETVQFGDKPATAITATAIKETADLFEYINSNAAEKIKNDSYVDDFAIGNSTRESTDELAKNITKILAKGGFHIKGFIKSGDTSEERLSLLGTGYVGRVLGIGWSLPADEFSVIVRINLSKKFKGKRKSDDIQEEEIPALISEKLTRRIILAVTNSIYDIYGFLVPVTIEMKLILRETYKRELKLGCDDDIPRELKEKWISVLKLLKEAESLRFRRCISYVNSVGDPELIVFNDGSPLAMCAVVYIRWQLESGEYACQLVTAKARVAPLERITIPRIEMSSAVLAVRLANLVVKSFRAFNFKETTHIADSKCTIATLAKDSTALKEYMGNRVSAINKDTKHSQWFYAKSADNIADIGTRPSSTIKDIDRYSEWQLGPPWLSLEKSEWPLTQDIGPQHVPEES